MAKQTINIGASPNDGTGTPLRTAFDYTNQNFTELYTATGPSGNNIVVPGSATIIGDLTVDTGTLRVNSSNDRVGIKTTNLFKPLTVEAGSTGSGTINQGLVINSSAAYGVGQGVSYSSLVFGRNRVSDTGSLIALCEIFGGNVLETSSDGGVLGFSTSNTSGTLTERYRIDNTGVATWSNVGGVAGTAMTLNASGLGVGDTPASNTRLTVAAASRLADTTGQAYIRSTDAQAQDIGAQFTLGGLFNASSHYAFGGIAGRKENSTSGNVAGYLDFLTTTSGGSLTSRMRIDSSGNVGIGGTPQAWNSSYKGVQVGLGAIFYTNAGTPNNGWFATNTYQNAANTTTFIGTGYGMHYRHLSGEHAWLTSTVSGSAGGTATMTQMMTLDASGILVVGNTAAANVGTSGGVLNAPNSGNSYTLIGHTSGSASGSPYCYFFYNSSSIGSITQNGTTGVLYNINSDYRLKESVAPLSGGLARVNALKPSIYKWKSDGSNGEGFLAHELAEVVPAAVTGEKDAVNEDGSIKSQGIDMSRIVPILVAAIQELTARVQTLEAK